MYMHSTSGLRLGWGSEQLGEAGSETVAAALPAGPLLLPRLVLLQPAALLKAVQYMTAVLYSFKFY